MKKKKHPNNPSEIEKMEKVRVGWVCGVKDTKWSQSTTYLVLLFHSSKN